MSPRPGTPFIHPELWNSLSNVGWTGSVCTIEYFPVGVKDEFGEDIKNWVFLPDHEAIPCRLAVDTERGGEIQRVESTTSIEFFLVRLKGYWPSITVKHRAIVDTKPYDIVIVEHDSEKTMTTLKVKEAA